MRIQILYFFVMSLLCICSCTSPRTACIVEECRNDKNVCEMAVFFSLPKHDLLEIGIIAGPICRDVEEKCIDQCNKKYIFMTSFVLFQWTALL